MSLHTSPDVADGGDATGMGRGLLDSSVTGPSIPVSRINRDMSDVNDFAEGSFGVVKRGILDIDKKQYAVKQTKKVISGEGDLQQRLQETYALSACKHPHVLRYYDSWVEDKSVLLRTELLPEQVQLWERPVAESHIVALLHQVSSALHTMHTCRVAHCDVKPSNILARRLHDGSYCFKLSDLGLARPLAHHDTLGTGEQFMGINDDDGDRNYLSPETLSACDAPLHSGEATDVYALGATCVELLGGDPAQVRAGNYARSLDKCSQWLQVLLRRMTSPLVAERPTAYEVAHRTLSVEAQNDPEVRDCLRKVAALRELVEESERELRGSHGGDALHTAAEGRRSD